MAHTIIGGRDSRSQYERSYNPKGLKSWYYRTGFFGLIRY
jgi:hypothetical protein